MLTRTLATLALLLAFSAGSAPLPPAAHRAQVVDLDDAEGCREAVLTSVPVAPASCTGEGQP